MSLEDGAAAHAADHNHWSRRQFLSGTSMMAAGGLILGSSPLLSWASPLLTALTEDPDNDRVLVLVRLKGGNDGLNTIVPFGDNHRRILYEGLRPTIKIDCNNLRPLQIDGGGSLVNSEFAVPDYAEEMRNMWAASNMAVIHNVGAANQNGSHFLGSDLMANGANNTTQYADIRRYSGWMGRYFDQSLPAFLSAPPTTPPVIQIGAANNVIFRGSKGTPYDLVFSDLTAFDEVLQSGQLYDTGMFGDAVCTADIERTFVRNVANSTLRYAQTVQDAYYNANYGAYEDDGLSKQLKKVGRLIKGGLKTKVYMVSLGGFDTHAGQEGVHPDLIQALSKAISAFHTDLGADGNRVLTMTFSEFGRTVVEKNTGTGAEGTDHGSLAPVMLFGNAVSGKKFYGTPIDLAADKIDSKGLVHFADKVEGGNLVKGQTGAIDFRHVYEKVLRDWLCVDAQTTENVLLRRPEVDINNNNNNHDYENCNGTSPASGEPAPAWDSASDCIGVNTTTHPTKGCDDPLGGMIIGGCQSTVSESSTLDAYIASFVALGYNIKEGDNTKVEIKYSIKMDANVKLEILNASGSKVAYAVSGIGTELRPLVEQYQEAGSYTLEFDSQPEIEGNSVTILNPNTNYIIRLEVNGMVTERTLTIH